MYTPTGDLVSDDPNYVISLARRPRLRIADLGLRNQSMITADIQLLGDTFDHHAPPTPLGQVDFVYLEGHVGAVDRPQLRSDACPVHDCLSINDKVDREHQGITADHDRDSPYRPSCHELPALLYADVIQAGGV
jgi:hypothetical protein